MKTLDGQRQGRTKLISQQCEISSAIQKEFHQT
jgi:hypothetical protein